MRDYSRDIPRDLQGNLEWREFVLTEERRHGGKYREWLRAACAADPLFYINTFVMQFNPKSMGDGSLELGPFVTWPFQDEAILKLDECIETGKDLIIEKSRELGASWACLIVLDRRARFLKLQKFLVISRNEDAVDDSEDPDSLFWKIDFIHRYLPSWLCGPVKRGSKSHSSELGVRRKKMSFFYERTNSYVTGQASTGKAGVGGRATAIFADEFSQINEARQILHRTSDTTNCRIFNGTHMGLDTAFYELCDPKSIAGGFIEKLQMHWSQHPDKVAGAYQSSSPVKVIDKSFAYPKDFKFVQDGSPSGGPFPGLRSPWYDDQCRRKGSKRAVAMDLDINPQGSISEFFDGLQIRHLIEAGARDPVWVGDIHYHSDTCDQGELVSSPTGSLKLWIHPREDRRVPLGYYAVGADIAAGTGATPSCVSIVRARGDEAGLKVAEYSNSAIKPEMLARMTVALCKMFHTVEDQGARLAWEMQGPGLVFGMEVMDMRYGNVYCRTDDLDRERKVSNRPGWVPTPQNKRVLLEEYRAALANGSFENRSEAALRECMSFQYTTTSVEHGLEDTDDPSGARVNHGDRVIADALAWKMAKEMGFERLAVRKEAMVVGTLAWRRQLVAAGSRDTDGW